MRDWIMDYAVIMAGGTGKRLWPLSRQSRPKQVLKLFDGQTLLRRCYDRLTPIFDSRNILVMTNSAYAEIVRENLPELPQANVIAEPAVRDTTGAIGLAATVLTKYDPDATMAVVTADQLIEPDDVFQRAMSSALKFINDNPQSLITFGIEPTFPSTQLGYVQLSSLLESPGVKEKVYRVASFSEKPDKTTAKQYLDTGQYCWNSGMFVWKAKTILDNLNEFLPDAAKPLKDIHTAWNGPNQAEVLNEEFLKIPRISIDFAVMEKAENVCSIRLQCQWFDLGSFAALADIIDVDDNNNVVVAGHSELLDCANNIIVTEEENHLIAAIGLENMVIAHSEDATLVCHVDNAQRLKELLELINARTGEKFL
jgi:mannose-1-phosphate guanylyltransferase